MRILMVAPEPIFEPRGTPLSVVGRLKAYSDMGHSVDLLTYPIGADVRLPNVRIHRIPRVPGIRRVKIGPSAAKLPLDTLLALLTAVWTARRGHAVLHTHEEAGFWGTALARVFGLPHVYDMHSSLPQQLSNFQFTRSKALVRVFEALEGWVLRHAAAVITICPDLERHVKAQKTARRSVMIENVVDYGMVFGEEDHSAEIRRKWGLAGRKVVLYTGTLEPYQGIDLLVDGAAAVLDRVPRALFLIVGGHTDQVEGLRGRIRERGLEDAFALTGQVLPQDVGGYIRCADALVSPRTRGTNTPLKIYAYLRSGVPVVATRLWTHTQVLDDGVAVLTDPDASAFAGGVVRVLTDRRLSASVARRAAALAEREYGYAAYRRKLAGVLASVTGTGA